MRRPDEFEAALRNCLLGSLARVSTASGSSLSRVTAAVRVPSPGVEELAVTSPAQRAFGGLPHPTILAACELLGVTEVYAAGETPVVAADGRSLARAIRVAGTVEPVFVEDIADMPRMILSAARDGDVVITMGAGSIGAVPGKLASIEEAV